MWAVRHGNSVTTRAILKLEVVPAVLLLSRDADTCEDRYTLLYVAVQKEDSVIAKLLLKYSPAELLYTENSVGQMPLDIASFNGLPRLTVRGITGPTDLSVNTEQYVPQKIMLFNEEKQKVEIPKLRAALDTLLAEGRIAHGTKLTTEFLAFADRMEEWHAEEIARKDAAEELEQEGELDPPRATM